MSSAFFTGRPSAAARLRDLLPRGTGLDRQDWRTRHRGMLAVLWLHVGGVPLFGIAQGYAAAHSLAEGAVLGAAALVAHSSRLGRAARSAAVAVGLLTASALLVHFSGGYVEFHFHFFVMIALLALYQHWLPFLLAIGYVVVHHGLAGALDPDLVYNHPDAIAHPWKWAAIHGGFVLAASAASVFTWQITEKEQQRRRDLEAITDAALARLPLVEYLEEVLKRVSRIVRADEATLALIEGGRLVVRTALGRDASSGTEFPLAAEVLATGTSAVGAADEDGRAAAVPLVVEGTVIGVLNVTSRHTGRFSDEQLRMLQLVADRAAPSIDRARLYEREHRVAETLQRSLLPKHQPAAPGLDLAVRYRPAEPGVQVGGDWYDVVALTDGKIGIAIGDVVGHGIESAALMGQLRTGLRAYAADYASPAGLLRKLSALLHDLDQGQMATLAFIELAPLSGEFRYACAGHPPPLLRECAGRTTYLDHGRTLPLGIGPRPPFRDGHGILEPGGCLVLYTDGLIERRNEPIDDGLAALRALVSSADVSDADALSEAVLAGRSPAAGCDDDVAIVVVRREAQVGAPLSMTFRTQPGSAGEVRQAIRRWLRQAGASPADTFALALATSEVAANAIEDAGDATRGVFWVEARRCADTVEIAVRGDRRWGAPVDAARRDRGLRMIDRLVDQISTEVSAHGATVRLRKRILGSGEAAVYESAASMAVASSVDE